MESELAAQGIYVLASDKSILRDSEGKPIDLLADRDIATKLNYAIEFARRREGKILFDSFRSPLSPLLITDILGITTPP
jgi:hypothetical protein